jgi:hypothetical protein
MPVRSYSRFGPILIAVVCAISVSARGQSMARVALNQWNANDYAITYGNPIFESSGHVHGADTNDNVEVQWSDNWGAIRLDNHDQDSPFIAYRFLIGQMNADSPLFHSTMDDVELAAGFHLGTYAGWKVSTMLGAGYDSTHPFVNEKGIFGIGDITAVHAINDQNSLVLAVDYNGNNAFLQDVPLPGFAFVHHDKKLDFMLGYPDSNISYRPIDKLRIQASYSVPYTASIDAEYVPWQHLGFYGMVGNTMQGIVISKENTIDRQFFQMRRVEVGVRVLYTPLINAGIGIGYAFDQGFSEGYDIRSLRTLAHISNAPYISFVLYGKF